MYKLCQSVLKLKFKNHEAMPMQLPAIGKGGKGNNDNQNKWDSFWGWFTVHIGTFPTPVASARHL